MLAPKHKHRLIRHRHEDGFTLIELMVVVLIIAILAAIAVPVYLNMQNEAAKASVKSDVRNTATNIAQYLAQNPNTTDLRGGASWEDYEATPNASALGFINLAANIAASNLSARADHGLADDNGYEIVLSENNRVEVYGSWENWRIYGQNKGVSSWAYAYYSNASDPRVPGNPDGKQYQELSGIPETGGGDPSAGGVDDDTSGGGNTVVTPAFTGVCETWPELKAAAEATIATWSSRIIIDYYWHQRQGSDAETAWMQENGDAYNAARSTLMTVLSQLDNSTGPNGEVGRIVREDTADPASHAMLNSFLDRDPATFTAGDFESIRNVGMQTLDQRCAPYAVSTMTFTGICEAWPELRNAAQITIKTWSSRLMVEYQWQKSQGYDAEQAWLAENGTAYNAAYSEMLRLLHDLDNSTGPNGENGLTIREGTADPVSNVMLDSYRNQDPSAFTATDYENIRNIGLQTMNDRCTVYTP